MKKHNHILKGILAIATLCAAMQVVEAQQSVNNWRGDEMGADWTDRYKWKLKHPPEGNEAAHFREPNSVITINRTVQLNNGMHLYGQELSLQGNGNIHMNNPVPHQRTVSIPASADGYANLTLNDNLSLNARVALSVNTFGTSASKGSITLKNRSNVTGALCVGKDGVGTGQVYVRGNATYRITGLELDTKADAGGSAEIHVLGGTVRIDTRDNPFKVFLDDPSRKIVLGDAGTLRIESSLSVAQKKDYIKKMISGNSLVAAPGCRLVTPVLQDKVLIAKAEDERNESDVKTTKSLLAAIDKIQVQSSAAVAVKSGQPRGLEALLASSAGSPTATTGAQATKSASAENTSKKDKDASGTKLAGYIVFFGIFLLALRRPGEGK